MLLIPLAGALAAAAAGPPVLRAMGDYLTMNGSRDEFRRAADLSPADFIFVLNGRVDTRGSTAAYLYLQGLAPRVLISQVEPALEERQPIHRRIVDRMVIERVPADSIEILHDRGPVRNTRDEAKALRHFLEGRGSHRVIVATTDYHVRRARLIMRQELRGLPVRLQVMGGPDTRGIEDHNWWRTLEGIRVYAGEYAKLVAAAFRLG
jgi:uncharacterized SAM-binding protein YcdF (DUF218 family)